MMLTVLMIIKVNCAIIYYYFNRTIIFIRATGGH